MRFVSIISILIFSLNMFAADEHKATHEHKHKHGRKCEHKAEKHGDHIDYEETVEGKVHHHKKHKNHYDECDAEESERTPLPKK